MSDATWHHAVAALYVGCNASRLLAYVPQIDAMVRRGRVDGVSVTSWLIFAVAHASTAAYAYEMRSDSILVWYGIANLIASLTIASLAAHGQRRMRVAQGAAGVSDEEPSRFYSAAHATGPSGRDDVRQRGDVDPAFLDPVARDQRDAVGLQFRPFDLASRIGERAARMEGAA